MMFGPLAIAVMAIAIVFGGPRSMAVPILIGAAIGLAFMLWGLSL